MNRLLWLFYDAAVIDSTVKYKDVENLLDGLIFALLMEMNISYWLMASKYN